MLTSVLLALGAKKGNFENNPDNPGVDNRQGLWVDGWAQAREKKKIIKKRSPVSRINTGWNLRRAK